MPLQPAAQRSAASRPGRSGPATGRFAGGNALDHGRALHQAVQCVVDFIDLLAQAGKRGEAVTALEYREMRAIYTSPRPLKQTKLVARLGGPS